MYRDQFGEFVCGYWGLKGSIALGMLKGHQNVFVYFLQRLDLFRKLSEIFKSRWDIFGNPSLDKTKISRV